MQLEAVGASLSAKKSIENVLVNYTGRFKILQELKKAMSSYNLETVKSVLVDSELNEEQIKLILTSKGLKDKQLEEATAEILDAQAKRKNEKTTEDLTKDTLNYKFVVEGLKNSLAGCVKVFL